MEVFLGQVQDLFTALPFDRWTLGENWDHQMNSGPNSPVIEIFERARHKICHKSMPSDDERPS